MDEIKSASSQQARGIIRSCLGKKFDGTNNFGVWRGEVSNLLVIQDLDASLQGVMPEAEAEAEWTKSNQQALSKLAELFDPVLVRRIRNIRL